MPYDLMMSPIIGTLFFVSAQETDPQRVEDHVSDLHDHVYNSKT